MRHPSFHPTYAAAAAVLSPLLIFAAPSSAIQTAPVAALASPSARPISDKYKPGNVIVSFEGGVVGDEIGKVMLSLVRDGSLLATTAHTVVAGDTPCGIMVARGYPVPCSAELLRALDMLNPKMVPSKGNVHIGNIMRVPDVWLRKYRTVRKFANSVTAERARSSSIQKNWNNLNIGAKSVGTDTELVSFNAYELILSSSNPGTQQKLLSRVNLLKSVNVRVSSIAFVAAPATAYSLRSPSDYQLECNLPSAPAKIDYRLDYIDSDADAALLVAQRPVNSKRARIYVVDVALDPTPNLAGAVDGPTISLPRGGWKCAWISASARDHATHLASIIASQDNGYGFVGVSPMSIIHSFPLIKPDASMTTGLAIDQSKEAELVDHFVTRGESTLPAIYLIATSFSPFPAQMLNNQGQIDAERRFERHLERYIVDVGPLLVVAAGQQDNPIQLSPNSPMSPQNLGDLRNVVVVTACESCTRNNPRLWAQANYSDPDGHYVHVAAPGGSPMLGWVNSSGVGALNGTSQAAAFAAGVLAEMIGRWPENYGSVKFAKKRIQVTSWPFYPGLGNNDYKRVATGMIDPNLALLDPAQHWIKESGGWRSVRLKGFSADVASFKRLTGATVPVPVEAIARIVRISPPSQPAQYVVYSDVRVLSDDPARFGEVQRDGPLSMNQPFSLKLCDDSTVALADLADVLIASVGIAEPPCAP